jgi:capsular exopolysaccharide synthesis family protein
MGDPRDVEDEAVDLRVPLAVLGRRWKVVVAVMALALVASLGLSVTQPTRYRATADLLVRADTSTSVISDPPSEDADQAARNVNDEVQVFESEAVEEAVDAAYDGPLDPRDVTAGVVSGTSDIVRASLTSSDAEEGAALVNLYVETFVQVRRSQRVDELFSIGEEIRGKISDLDKRISSVRGPLDELERRVTESPNDAALREQRDSMAASLSATLTPLESRRAFFQSQLESGFAPADITDTGGAQVVRGAKAGGSVSSRPVRDAAVALVLGTLLGVALAFVVDAFDDRVRTVADLERISGAVPTLALIPVSDSTDPAFVGVRDDPRAALAESFRGLRTALKLAAIDQPFRIVQITSPTAGDGKTTTVANLAVAIAEGGDRVAVVCCDLRRPRLHDRLMVDLQPGLTDVLLGDHPLGDAVQRTAAGVDVLAAGTPPPNPSELLSSEKTAAVVQALALEVDVVLLDCPPVLPVTDALVVSRLADATVVVVDSRSTERRAIRRALQQLEQVGAPVVGVVLNGIQEGVGHGDADLGHDASPSDESRAVRR